MLPHLLIVAMALSVLAGRADCAERVVVGSKRFTESYILGDIVARTAQQAGADALHKPGLGSSAVVLEALKIGSIDLYPEYLGTIEQEILKLPAGSSTERIQQELAKQGLAWVCLGASPTATLWPPRRRARKSSRCARSPTCAPILNFPSRCPRSSSAVLMVGLGSPRDIGCRNGLQGSITASRTKLWRAGASR